MKKLLFINGHLKSGGCERSLTDLLQNIDYTKYSVDLLLVEDLGDYLEEIPKEVNVIFYDLKKAYGKFGKCVLTAVKNRDWFSVFFRINSIWRKKFGVEKIKYTKRLFKCVKDHYDAIIAYRPGICTELAAFTFSADKKISWWHHGEFYDFGDVAATYNEMSSIVAVSVGSAEIVKTHFPESTDKVRIIPNMLPAETILKKSSEYSIEKKKVLTLVSIGRFSQEKNMTLCPTVGKALREKNIKFLWYLIGDGGELESVKQKVEDYSLKDSIVFTGNLGNPYPYVAMADLMVHTSLVESQGITLLESMALGTPVITVESLGPKEFIKHRVNGYLVSNNSGEIANLIISVMNEDKDNIIFEAKKTVSEFEPHIIMKKFEELIG